jgi:hydrogenase maturation protein HypF
VVRVAVRVRGVVQGVGFRPLVYSAATARGLSGWVKNQTDGLHIEIEGPKAAVHDFVAMLSRAPPPGARLDRVEIDELPPSAERGFRILSSAMDAPIQPTLPADRATCGECISELQSPAERRYRYPFINCTHCGPRYSIIEELPYDRSRTTMKRFPLCDACAREYRTPSDRRFHAQPIACPACGPRLRFLSSGQELASEDPALRRAVQAIEAGQILALKGLGGFQLLVDAGRNDAVALLRERKQRQEKPFAIMFPSLEAVRVVCTLSAAEEHLLASPEAPIVLVRRRSPGAPGSTVAEGVAPGNPWLGVMLPYTPLHRLLLTELARPVVCTSGNLADEPMCTHETEAQVRLGTVADVFLVHDRPIVRPLDDSVVRMGASGPQVLRRARGFAPLPLPLGENETCLLALGGQLKSTIALAKNGQVVVSQHLGDLSSPEGAMLLERCVGDLVCFFAARPEAVACDLHPDYVSTRLAERLAAAWSVPLERVQHHHAHVAACMAEHGLSGPILGLAWDGVGLGTDGTIWGGEALVVQGRTFRRAAHLRSFSLPGGERAVREPRRAALGLLYEIFGTEALQYVGSDFPAADIRVLFGMLQRRVNAPRTTSMGRLFDAVAALTGIRARAGFEGQAAMALEFAADNVHDAAAYPFPLDDGEPARADWEPLVRAVLSDCRRGTPRACISARFHNAVAGLAGDIAARVGLPRVVLSGGCFQNLRLARTVHARLVERGFEVYAPARYPPNDGGLSLGQAWVAAQGRKE